jgi:uncharacterized protein with FMN-binding domain
VGYTRTRAAGPAPRIQAAQATSQAKARWRDGSWRGRGHCPHGDIIATVTIKEGRIHSAVVSQCLTRYSCDVIEELPPQVAQRQSPEVDYYVSGATESTDAFYDAVTEALTRARL